MELSPSTAAQLRRVVLDLVSLLHEMEKCCGIDKPTPVEPAELQQQLYNFSGFLEENLQPGHPVVARLAPLAMQACGALLDAIACPGPLTVLRPFVLNLSRLTPLLTGRMMPVPDDSTEQLVDLTLRVVSERPALVPPAVFQEHARVLELYVDNMPELFHCGTPLGDRVFETSLQLVTEPWLPEDTDADPEQLFNVPMRMVSVIGSCAVASRRAGTGEELYGRLTGVVDALLADADRLEAARDPAAELRRRAAMGHVAPAAELQSEEGRRVVAATLLAGAAVSCVLRGGGEPHLGGDRLERLWSVYERVFGGVPADDDADDAAVSAVRVETVEPEQAAAAAGGDDDNPAQARAGYMEKRGAINPGFKKRWFRFETDGGSPRLVYAAGPADKQKGAVPLKGAAVLEAPPGAKGDRTDLQWAVKTPGRTYVFRSASAEDKRAWLDAARRVQFEDAARHALDAHHPDARRSRAQSRAVRAPAAARAAPVSSRTRYDAHVMWAATRGLYNFLSQCVTAPSTPEFVAGVYERAEALVLPCMGRTPDPLYFAVQLQLVKCWLHAASGLSRQTPRGYRVGAHVFRRLVPLLVWAARHSRRAHRSLVPEDVRGLYLSDVADSDLAFELSSTLVNSSKAPSLFEQLTDAECDELCGPLMQMLADPALSHLRHRVHLAAAAVALVQIVDWSHRVDVLPRVLSCCMRALADTSGLPEGAERAQPRAQAFTCMAVALRDLEDRHDTEVAQAPQKLGSAVPGDGGDDNDDDDDDNDDDEAAPHASQKAADAAADAAAAAAPPTPPTADWDDRLARAVAAVKTVMPDLMRHVAAAVDRDYGVHYVTRREEEEVERQRLARENPEEAAAMHAAEAEKVERRRASSVAGRDGMAAGENARNAGMRGGNAPAPVAEEAPDGGDDDDEITATRTSNVCMHERTEAIGLLSRVMTERLLAPLLYEYLPRVVAEMAALMVINNGDLQYEVCQALCYVPRVLPQERRWRAGAVHTAANDEQLKRLVTLISSSLLDYGATYPNMIVSANGFNALANIFSYGGPVAVVSALPAFTQLAAGTLDASAACVHPEVRQGKDVWRDIRVDQVCGVLNAVGQAAAVCGTVFADSFAALEPHYARLIEDGSIPVIVGADLLLSFGHVLAGVKDLALFERWMPTLLRFSSFHSDYRVLQSAVFALGSGVHACGAAATKHYDRIFNALLPVLFARVHRNVIRYGILDPARAKGVEDAAAAGIKASAAAAVATADDPDTHVASKPPRPRAATAFVPPSSAPPRAAPAAAAEEPLRAGGPHPFAAPPPDAPLSEAQFDFREGAADNSLVTVAKMVLRAPGSVDMDQAVPLLIRGLPLLRNVADTNFVVTAVMKLVNQQQAVVDRTPHELVHILATFLLHPSVKPQMRPGVRRLAKSLGERHPDAVGVVLPRLTERHQTAWAEACSE